MSDIKNRILNKLQEPTLACLATITEDGKPWVRYITPYADDEMNMWCATMAASRKVTHIRKNCEVHLTVGCGDATSPPTAYLQIQAVAEILDDPASRKLVWGDHLSQFFSGPQDPNLIALKFTPYRIELQAPSPTPPMVWEPNQH